MEKPPIKKIRNALKNIRSNIIENLDEEIGENRLMNDIVERDALNILKTLRSENPKGFENFVEINSRNQEIKDFLSDKLSPIFFEVLKYHLRDIKSRINTLSRKIETSENNDKMQLINERNRMACNIGHILKSDMRSDLRIKEAFSKNENKLNIALDKYVLLMKINL